MIRSLRNINSTGLTDSVFIRLNIDFFNKFHTNITQKGWGENLLGKERNPSEEPSCFFNTSQTPHERKGENRGP